MAGRRLGVSSGVQRRGGPNVDPLGPGLYKAASVLSRCQGFARKRALTSLGSAERNVHGYPV
jgi:hypothetical protein